MHKLRYKTVFGSSMPPDFIIKDRSTMGFEIRVVTPHSDYYYCVVLCSQLGSADGLESVINLE